MIEVVNFENFNKLEQFVNDDDVLIFFVAVVLELVILIGTVVHDETLNDADRCTCNEGVDEENTEE